MRPLELKIIDIRKVKKDVYSLALFSPALARKTFPGQFLHIRVKSEKVLLRRPFSIHRVDKSNISILFKVKGTATNILSRLHRDGHLDVLGPLGNHFSYSEKKTGVVLTEKPHSKIVLVAGGMGVAPLVFLAQKINKLGTGVNRTPVLALLGAKTKLEILCENDFKKLGCKIRIATDDGSGGFKGIVTNLLKKTLNTHDAIRNAKIYACGPEAMLRSLSDVLKKFPNVECEASFEQFMGCGIGICYGCVIKSKAGYKKVCKDGPVFDLRDIY